MNDRELHEYWEHLGEPLPEPPTPRFATGGDMNRVAPSGADSGQFLAVPLTRYSQVGLAGHRATMTERVDGDWVRYEDVARMLAAAPQDTP